MNSIVVTTSWDDGHIADLTLAKLLAKYNLAGTFYIAPKNHQLSPDDRLNESQVRAMADRFEIGAHTMTHPRLSAIDAATAREEIVTSKSTLEDWTGKKISSFCYPEGRYTPEHKNMIHDAGFSLARTIKGFSLTAGHDAFEVPTTVHAYRHWSDIAPIFREAGAAHFIKQYLNWDDLAIALFEKVRASGGVFHLWGHSWEIDENKDWRRLDRVFRHISNHKDVDYIPNGQLSI